MTRMLLTPPLTLVKSKSKESLAQLRVSDFRKCIFHGTPNCPLLSSGAPNAPLLSWVTQHGNTFPSLPRQDDKKSSQFSMYCPKVHWNPMFSQKAEKKKEKKNLLRNYFCLKNPKKVLVPIPSSTTRESSRNALWKRHPVCGTSWLPEDLPLDGAHS